MKIFALNQPRETTGKNRLYHCEMMLLELMKLDRSGGDTRACLSLDLPEQQILIELLSGVTGIQDYVVADGPAKVTEAS